MARLGLAERAGIKHADIAEQLVEEATAAAERRGAFVDRIDSDHRVLVGRGHRSDVAGRTACADPAICGWYPPQLWQQTGYQHQGQCEVDKIFFRTDQRSVVQRTDIKLALAPPWRGKRSLFKGGKTTQATEKP